MVLAVGRIYCHAQLTSLSLVLYLFTRSSNVLGEHLARQRARTHSMKARVPFFILDENQTKNISSKTNNPKLVDVIKISFSISFLVETVTT